MNKNIEPTAADSGSKITKSLTRPPYRPKRTAFIRFCAEPPTFYVMLVWLQASDAAAATGDLDASTAISSVVPSVAPITSDVLIITALVFLSCLLQHVISFISAKFCKVRCQLRIRSFSHFVRISLFLLLCLCVSSDLRISRSS